MDDQREIAIDIPASLGQTMGYDDEGTTSKDDERSETTDEKPTNIISRFLPDFNRSEEILLLLGLVAIALDPFFFYVPTMKNHSTCLGLDNILKVVLVVLRTSVDILHDLLWWSKSGRCGKPVSSGSRRPNLNSRSKDYKTPSPGRMPNKDKISPPHWLTWVKNSTIFSAEGRSSGGARIMAITASLPLLQVVVLAVDLQSHLMTWIKFGVICQFVPRILRCYPTYMVAITSYQMYAWIQAAFNLLLFALVSQAVGGLWYLRSVERRMDCMEGACRGLLGCSKSSLYCETGNYVFGGNISDICTTQTPSNGAVPFEYGMFRDAISLDLIGSTDLSRKVSGSFWWGINKISNIPTQLRRKLKTYFCKNLFHKVKEFEELNGKIKEALRERASVVVFQSGTSIYTEGYPTHRMIHTVQGKVLTFSSNDANEKLRAEELKEGDSIGEELLLRALESPLPKHPFARKTIQSLTKVGAMLYHLMTLLQFTKYGRLMETYREEWAANTITGAFRKRATMKERKKSYLE